MKAIFFPSLNGLYEPQDFIRRHKKDAQIIFTRLEHQPSFLYQVKNFAWANQKEMFTDNFTVTNDVRYKHN